MRILFAIALTALLCAAGTVAFFYDTFYGLVLPAILVFSKRFVWRIAYRFVWVLIFIPFLPDSWRHAYFDFFESLKAPAFKFWRWIAATWSISPWPIRALMSFAGALVAGLTAMLLLILPIHVGKVPFIGAWLRESAMPYLMRTATAKSIEAHIPPAWRKVPAGIRFVFEKPYKKLWRITARWAVRSRQTLGRRALMLEHRKHVIRLQHRYY